VLRADSKLIEVAVPLKELGDDLGELDVADPDFVRLLHFYLRGRIFRRCRSSLDISLVQLRQKQNSAIDEEVRGAFCCARSVQDADNMHIAMIRLRPIRSS